MRLQGLAFFEMVGASLSLVANVDQLRYSRILDEIRTLIQMPVLGGAAYFRTFKVCTIDLRVFLKEKGEMTVKLLAAALVHEATHGYLHSRRIMCNADPVIRIQRAC